MNGTYLDLIAAAGAGAISHIGLVNAAGTELASAGYARQAVTWTGPTGGDGLVRPDADLVFDMTAGDEVAGWRGYSAATGGTDYDGATFATVNFSNDGTFTLLAAQTAIDHDAA